MSSKIIVALDYDQAEQCWSFVKQLSPQQCGLKIGSQMFTVAGPAFVSRCIDAGFRIFLDLKFHDIPTTVAKAVKAAADLGVWMINVHASGGGAMLQVAKEALMATREPPPLLIAVTVLTSQDDAVLKQLGISDSLPKQAERLAQLAYDNGLDGVVCSGHEIGFIKNRFGKDFLTVVPGIRLQASKPHDQIRTLSPAEACREGADFIVLGRLLTEHPEPCQLLDKLYGELHSG